jgi:hypothetical protein
MSQPIEDVLEKLVSDELENSKQYDAISIKNFVKNIN